MTKRIVLLQALAATPNDVRLLLRHAPPTAVSVAPAPDVWSMADVLCHLTLVEGLYRARLQRVVAEERPFLPVIHPNPAAHETTLPPDDLIARFAAARAETLAFLTELKPGQWQRPAEHATWGVMTFRYLVQRLVDHDTDHLAQLAELQPRIRRAAESGAA